MPGRSLSADNFEPGVGPEKFDVSGKNRDYYTSRNGPAPFARGITPEGAVVEPGNGYRYHVYFAPATVEYYGSPVDADYLVVAGGGGAGGHWSPTPSSGSPGSGGGGAGGMLTGTLKLYPGPYPILVGGGGNGGSLGGIRGGNSRFATIDVTGGGGGGGGFSVSSPTGVGPPLFWCRGAPGGSGGGGGSSPIPNGYPSTYYTGGTGNDPPLVPPQGNPGGGGYSGTAASGGGAGSGGSSGSTAGIGRTDIRFAAPLIAPAIPAPLRPTWTTLVGDNGTYASGGRGNYATTSQGNITGGGGNGGGSPGYSYTGGGGSGYGFRPGPHGSYSGGSGGSGIVIVRYPI